MIRIAPAPEPADFEKKVRRPGLSAIAELVGEKPQWTRGGPRREKVAECREEFRRANSRTTGRMRWTT